MSFKNIQKQLQNTIIRGFILFPPLIIIILISIIILINLFLNFIESSLISWLFGIYVSTNVYLFIGIFILLYSDFIEIKKKYK